MGRYRKIDVRIWSDSKFKQFTKTQKLIWLHALTAPETTSIPGVLLNWGVHLCKICNLDPRTYRKNVDVLEKIGLVKTDWDNGLLFIPNAFKYNLPENANVVKGYEKVLDEIPECLLKDTIIDALRKNLENMERFRKGLPNRLPNPFDTVPEGLPKPVTVTGTGTGTGGGIVSKTKSPPSLNPTSNYIQDIKTLVVLFSQVWNTDPPKKPIGDLKLRVTQALDVFGSAKCKLAIKGHHKISTSPNSQHGRSFHHIFPAQTNGTVRLNNKLDENKFDAFIKEGLKLSKKKTVKAYPRINGRIIDTKGEASLIYDWTRQYIEQGNLTDRAKREAKKVAACWPEFDWPSVIVGEDS